MMLLFILIREVQVTLHIIINNSDVTMDISFTVTQAKKIYIELCELLILCEEKNGKQSFIN
jgi:hypothetical protein